MNEKPDEGDPATGQPGVEAWDRVGEFLNRANDAGRSIAQRHLNLWNEVSANLRKSEFGADDWARNGARFMATAIDDAQEVWDIWRSPLSEPTAGAIPAVSLFFVLDDLGQGEDAIPDVQWIAAPRSVQTLPQRAEISLSGGPSPTAAAKVRHAIAVERDPKGTRNYCVTCSLPPPPRARRAAAAGAQAQRSPLQPGSYFGVVYLETDRQDVVIADLRVVVRTRSGS